MSATSAHLISRLYLECFNEGRLDAADKVIGSSLTTHTGDKGPEGFKQTVTRLRAAFSDLHFSLNDVLSDRDRVIVRWTMTGTHRGAYMGVSATQKPVVLTAIAIYRMEGRRAVEQWSVVDRLGLLQQLGVVAGPGAPTSALQGSREQRTSRPAESKEEGSG